MMSTLTHYLYRRILGGIVMAALIIGVLVFVVDYVELSRQLDGEERATAAFILYLTALKMPGMLEQTLPFVVLFGVMAAMTQLNRRSELVAMRAAGLSAWRFVTPAAICAGLIGLVTMTALNPIAADLNARFETTRIALTSANGTHAGARNASGYWFREVTNGETLVVHAGDILAQSSTLFNLTFFYYRLDETDSPVFLHRLDAKRAELLPGQWVLHETLDTPPKGDTTRRDILRLETSIAPSALVDQISGRALPSFYSLPHIIAENKRAGFNARQYQLQFQRLLALPLTLAAMALIGASFSLRLVRLGGLLSLSLLAGASGFLLYFASDLLEALGTANVLPPFFAVWAAPFFALFAALARITILEDG